MIQLIIIGFILNFCFIGQVLARGGGGGSGSGGVGGLLYLPIAIILAIIAWYKRKKKIEKAEGVIHTAEQYDTSWNEDALRRRVGEVFCNFQKAWSNFDVDSMKNDLTDNYHKRMVLELNVLNNQKRKNMVNNPTIMSIAMIEAIDETDNTKDSFTAEVKAKANDILIDTQTSRELYVDNEPFTEYWEFKKEGSTWKLDLIKQATEASELEEQTIIDFASRNNFFYDPDFGWLMMPNKGVIFRRSNFKVSDINNHVIGYYREKIVEFYTYIPRKEESFIKEDYIIAQAILPINYKDILIRKKKLLNFGPCGLKRMFLESIEFNKKFCLWADSEDRVSSLELLTPNFMEKIYDLPFELNIEIVGSFLYFYTKDRSVQYDQMLGILSWAFDEMKM